MDAIVGKTILIAEGEQDIAQLVPYYLRKKGGRSVTAMSGVEALKQVTVLCSRAKWRSLPSEDMTTMARSRQWTCISAG
jgi:hypothetical protein